VEPIKTQADIEKDLWDPEDHAGMRQRIEERVLGAVGKAFPAEYGNVRLEVENPRIAGPDRFTKKQEREAILKRDYLYRPMKANLVLKDKTTGEEIDRRENTTLMKVPYYTDDGVFIHRGNNYTGLMQSRMVPGIYTRKQNNGTLEAQINTRVGTGKAFRVAFDPEKAQFRFRVKGSDLHLYSILKDLGVDENDMREAWGDEVLEMNKLKYDVRAVPKAFGKMVPSYAQETSGGPASGVLDALKRAQVARKPVTRTLHRYWVEPRATKEAKFLDSLLDPLFKSAADIRNQGDFDDEGDEYMPVGVEGLLAASRKLLAVNRGQDVLDDRHTPAFAKVFTLDKLLAERIKFDEGRRKQNLMRRLSNTKSLKGFVPGTFDGYLEEFITMNPLTTPGEETNPMSRVSQHRRVTQMGPGGIGSTDAITSGMQNIQASEFGFISPIEGPECFDRDSEVYTLRGWVPWPEIQDDDVFACRIDGRLEWHKASKIVRETYSGRMIVAESETFRMCVTPGHRVLWKTDPFNKTCRIDLAGDVIGRTGCVPIRHEPCTGNPDFTVFTLPDVPKTNNNQRAFDAFDIKDWCAFMGWWLSEGCLTRPNAEGEAYKKGALGITQCPVANPEQHAEIRMLLKRMGLAGGDGTRKNFTVTGKQLVSYFLQWTNGCYDKYIPEELFDAPVYARQALLDSLLKGDGRYNEKRWCYCTVSERLAKSVERLAIGLGYTAFIRTEEDPRPHVLTTNFVVSIHRQLHRSFKATSHTHSNGKEYGNYWSEIHYDGVVYCAVVPGGLLHVRGKKSNSGFWSGNSSTAGIDVRLASGVKVGSDGRLRRRMRNVRSGAMEWVSPEDLVGKKVALPD